jgi:hypothetical protein
MTKSVTFSRRSLLQNIGIGGTALAAATTASVRTSLAEGKIPKSQARYQTSPNGDRRCAVCSHFTAPSSCDIVEGDVSPQGWCQFFGQKT